jgi:hypothetical protein
MDPAKAKILAALLNAAIPFFGGLIAFLWGCRSADLRSEHDQAYNDRMEASSRRFKWAGILLMVAGIVLAISRVALIVNEN